MNQTSQAKRTHGLITRLRHLVRGSEPPITGEAFREDLNKNYLAPQDAVSMPTVARWLYGEEYTGPSGIISSESALAIQSYCEDLEAKHKKPNKK